MEVKEKILETSLMLFYKFGIKGVTMDDIAREMGISKKTIYRYYKEKDDIVNALCEEQMQQNRCDFDKIAKQAKDPIHETILIYTRMQKIFEHINPVFFYDLHKSYSEALKKFNDFKRQYILGNIRRNITEGIEKGLFRKDLDIDFVSNYRLAQLDMLMKGESFNIENNSYGKVHGMVMDIFMHGISTVKGHKLINKYKNKTEDE